MIMLTEIYDQFYYACCDGEYEDVEKIIINKKVNVNCRFSSDGNTPLTLSAFHGHFEVCTILLENGANVDAQDRCGWTALCIIAARNGNLDLCWLMVDHGADINVQLNQHDGWAALSLATASIHEATVEFLLENGAFVDLKDNNGYTALDVAKKDPSKTSERIVSILERSSNPPQDDLWNACRDGNIEEVTRMRSEQGQTLFHQNARFQGFR